MKATTTTLCAAMIAAACVLGCHAPEHASAMPSSGPTAPASGPVSGYYVISPQGHPASALAVSGEANASGTPVATEAFGKKPGQEWLLKRQDDGSYKVYAFCAINSLQMLDTSSDGASVVTGEDDAVDGKDDATQRWHFAKTAGGYQIASGSDHPAALTATSDGVRLEPAAGDGSGQVFGLHPVTTPTELVNPKKGLPVDTETLARAAHALHCSWAYNWGIQRNKSLADDIQFVPMIWNLSGGQHTAGSPDTVAPYVAKMLAANPGTKYVLGYNEPDEPYTVGGSDIPEPDGLAGFKDLSDLSAKGITVGGPACAIDVDPWMKSFMSAATLPPYNYHIDFIGFHDYPSESNVQGAAYGMLGYMDAVHKMYNLPIWATEFAPIHLSQADTLTFIRIVCQGMQQRDYIQRYSMFTSQPVGDTGMGASALVNADGSLTEAGKLYARM